MYLELYHWYYTGIVVIHIYMCHMANATCDQFLPSQFVHQPADIIVVEGANASFMCSVSNFNRETDTLSWNVYPSFFQTIVKERYNPNTREITHNLLLINVDRRKQHQHCELRRLDKTGHLQICHSKIVTYTIWFFPTQEELSCGQQNNTKLTEIQPLEIWCKIRQGNPPVDLSFDVEGTEFLHQKYSDGSSIGINITLMDTHLIGYRNITCLATGSEIFQNRQLICNIGPLSVWAQSKTFFDETNKSDNEISFPHHAIHYICAKDAESAIINTVWSCMPRDILEGNPLNLAHITFYFQKLENSFLRSNNNVIAKHFTRYHKTLSNNSTCTGNTCSPECSLVELTFLQSTSMDDDYSGQRMSFDCSVKYKNLITGHKQIAMYFTNETGMIEEKHTSHQQPSLLPDTYTCKEVRSNFSNEKCLNLSSDYPFCYCRNSVNKERISTVSTPYLPTLDSTPVSQDIRYTRNHVNHQANTTTTMFIPYLNTKEQTDDHISITTVIAITAILLSILLPLITALLMHRYCRYGQTNVPLNNSQSQLSLSPVSFEVLQETSPEAAIAGPSSDSSDLVYEDPMENLESTPESTNLKTTDFCYDSDVLWNRMASSSPSSSDLSSVHSMPKSWDYGSTLSDSCTSSNISNLSIGLDPFYENHVVFPSVAHETVENRKQIQGSFDEIFQTSNLP